MIFSVIFKELKYDAIFWISVSTFYGFGFSLKSNTLIPWTQERMHLSPDPSKFLWKTNAQAHNSFNKSLEKQEGPNTKLNIKINLNDGIAVIMHGHINLFIGQKMNILDIKKIISECNAS